MTYSGAALYFMSGTGNTFRTAEWMAAVAESHGVQSRVLPVERRNGDAGLSDGPSSLVGLLMPTHGFTAPWHMIRFALRLPRRHGTHAFVVSTRAGTKLGRLHFPGMEGTASYLIALILAIKGYCVRGVLGLDMPSNWLAAHPGFGPVYAGAIIARAKPKAERFMERILSGKRVIGGFICLLLGLALLPVSAGYLLFGRFFLAKLFFASNRCNGCNQCAQDCPVGAIRMWGKKKRPYWTFSCESCMRCMAYCPKEAVEAGHSWGVLLYYATAVPVAMYILPPVSSLFPWVGRLGVSSRRWLEMLITYPYFLASLALSYAAFTLLIRIPVINALFTYTTLTHIYRRYHEPDTDRRHLTGDEEDL